MKKPVLLFISLFSFAICFGQKHLLSYDDFRYIVTNNLQKTDTFMMAKGYTVKTKNSQTNNLTYSSESGDSRVGIEVRRGNVSCSSWKGCIG